jgi:hypothetical protein
MDCEYVIARLYLNKELRRRFGIKLDHRHGPYIIGSYNMCTIGQ